MTDVINHILVADVGGTHVGIAIFRYCRDGRFEISQHKTYRSDRVSGFGNLLRHFMKTEARSLQPKVVKACIDFAGPVEPKRTEAVITNLSWGFTAAEVFDAIQIEELTLLNDFEAVGFGLEVLLANRPKAFVQLSRIGKLPPLKGRKPTAVVIGAGTGLGTTILVHDSATGRYRPVPGEGGHRDFVAIEEDEFRIAQWIRSHLNDSAREPLDCEKIVSGPGLNNIFLALSELEPDLGNPSTQERVFKVNPYDRPAVIVRNAKEDALCRKTVDTWLRCYARAAKNSAIFPLAPGGVFLAGGVAAKILPEMQSGLFMKEFIRCDRPNIRTLLKRTPVFVVTDYRIGLYGCANVAINFAGEFGLRNPLR
jgi:glucokinase